VGGGAISIPSYPGSTEHRVLPFPLAKVTYRDRVYAGPSSSGAGMGIGAHAIRTRQVTLSGEVGFLQDRPTSRGDGLAGMDDQGFAVTASAAASYALGPIQASLSVAQGLNAGAGLSAGGQIGVGLPVTARTLVSAGVGATWADRRQMRRDFGVTVAEAARRQALLDGGDARLPDDAGVAYAPQAGLHHLTAGLMVMHLLTAHWGVIGLGSVERLSDAAARSSLVETRTQVTGGLAVGYRF
jgi:outer membrane protein